MCSCLDGPDGQGRPTRRRALKLVFLLLFLVGSSQLFALIYHFVRLLGFLVLDPQRFPPRPLPQRTSLFGVDLLQFDSSHVTRQSRADDTTFLYVLQAVVASVLAILCGTLGTTGICNERTTLNRTLAAFLSVVTFFTAFGSLTFPAMTPLTQVVVPLVGGTVAALVLLVFTCVFPSQSSVQQQQWYHHDDHHHRYSRDQYRA